MFDLNSHSFEACMRAQRSVTARFPINREKSFAVFEKTDFPVIVLNIPYSLQFSYEDPESIQNLTRHWEITVRCPFVFTSKCLIKKRQYLYLWFDTINEMKNEILGYPKRREYHCTNTAWSLFSISLYKLDAVLISRFFSVTLFSSRWTVPTTYTTDVNDCIPCKIFCQA